MSPSLILYGNNVSTAQVLVKLTLYEKNITDFTFAEIDFPSREHKSAAHLARHPLGKVPAFEDRETGVAIIESRAIARYIAVKYAAQGTPGLVPGPDDLVRFAKFEQMMAFEASNWDPPMLELNHESFYGPLVGNKPADPEKEKRYVEKVDAILAVYDRLLEGKKYLCGEEFTLADLAHLGNGALARRIGQVAQLWAKYPNVEAWWTRLEERESWQRLKAECVVLYGKA